MKTKTTYPEKANKAKVILIAVLISIQAALIAGDSSTVKKDSNYSSRAYKAGIETLYIQAAQSGYLYLDEVASEPEYEIEDWMSNVHNNYKNVCVDEEDIELEEWMCNTQHSFWKDLDEVAEPELVIEDWMTHPEDWFENTEDIMLTSK